MKVIGLVLSGASREEGQHEPQPRLKAAKGRPTLRGRQSAPNACRAAALPGSTMTAPPVRN